MIRKKEKVTLRRSRKLIISVEGFTELDYIDLYRIQFRIPEGVISVFKSEGTDPLTIINKLVDHVKHLKKNKMFDPNQGDLAFAVFDVDEHRQNKIAIERFDNALFLANQNNIIIISSNPCIENWLHLHFDEMYTHHDRVAARRRLKMHPLLGSYDKRIDEKFFNLFFAEIGRAVNHANSQYERTVHNNSAEFRYDLNPYTKIQDLVTEINLISKKFED